MRSTFASFTTAQLALRASQYGFDVTGQNVANINTSGYTRQVVDQISLNMQNAGRYADLPNVGYGTLVTGISQVRDPYLDIRFRNEVAKVGEADVKLAGLQEIESVLDEVTAKGMQTQLSDLNTMLQKLSDNVGSKEYDNMVKSSADALTKYLNQCAKQLETIRSNQEYNFKEVEIPEINNILENITALNKSIKDGQINGNPGLELLDQRNVLIDKLASYVKIDVTYVPTKISDSLTIDELRIDLVGKDNNINLINHLDRATFVADTSADGTITLNILDKNNAPATDNKFMITEEESNTITSILTTIATLNNDIESSALLTPPVTDTEKINLRTALLNQLKDMNSNIKVSSYEDTSTGTTVKRLRVYLKADGESYNILDHDKAGSLTISDADILNDGRILTIKPAVGASTEITNELLGTDVFSQLTNGSIKGSLEFLNSSGEFDGSVNSFKGIGYYQKMLDVMANTLATTFNNLNNLTSINSTTTTWATGHELFGASDGSSTITAKNISVATGWANSEYTITPSVPETVGGSTASGANDNVLRMIDALKKDQNFMYDINNTPTDGSDDKEMFSGSFHEFVSNLNTTLGIDVKSISTLLDNYVSVSNEIANAKSSISSVSLDEEGMNMLKYQKSYAAAARFMTTIDEALDTLINRMGMVGR